MWIVRLALNRPYTFIVLALLILLASPVVISRTPTDIFPNINIPVVAVAWQFTGLNPEEMEGRFTTGFERILTTVVDNIQHIESTTINGQSIIKVFLQPNASLDTANAQITAVSQVALRQLPAGAQPPLILNFSASTVPIIQLALSGEGLSEQQLNDIGLNFLRTQLVTVPGAAVPYPYGGKQTQVMIDLNPALLQSKGLSATDVVNGIRTILPRVAATLPPQLKIQPLADQSIFVRSAVSGVIREAVIAACLTGLMILIFLASWRSTLIIAVSIPLSILTSIIVLSFLGETINIMTLGGLALAVGMLVDDATVEIENTNRNLDQGKEIRQAILDGASQIAVPALVSTLCICIVFLPMFFLSGVARYLFVPLAESVVFAMLASYLLSRTLVPTLALYLLKAKDHHASASRNPFIRFQDSFERGFERLRLAYQRLLTTLVHRRFMFVPVFLLLCLCAWSLAPWLGENFFPDTDSGQFMLHVRAKTGTRIEETARLSDLIESSIRRVVPPQELDNLLDYIRLPHITSNFMQSTYGLISNHDHDILVSLT